MNRDEMKEKGNAFFNSNNYEDAASCYLKAIKLCSDRENEILALLYNNYALCALKTKNFSDAINYTTNALAINAHDIKALYRRCVAYEEMDNITESFKDAKTLFEMNQKFILPTYFRLKDVLSKKVENCSSSAVIVDIMDKIKSENTLFEIKHKAFNNLESLTQENFGVNLFFQNECLNVMQKHLLQEKSQFITPILNIYKNICIDKNKTLALIKVLSLPTLINNIIQVGTEEITKSAYKLLIKIFVVLTGSKIDDIKNNIEYDEYSDIIDSCFLKIVETLVSPITSPYGRDVCLNTIVRLAGKQKGLGWSIKLIQKFNAIPILLCCASELKNSSIQIENSISGTKNADDLIESCYNKLACTPSTHCLISLALNTLWEDMSNDALRNEYRTIATKYIENLLSHKEESFNIKAIKAIIVLLQGPFFIGDSVVGSLNISKLILEMADSKNNIEKLTALDALILTASNRKRCQGILVNGVPLLKKLYLSKNDEVRIRALLGICKLGASGGIDASLAPFEENSNRKIAEACKSFLCHPEDKSLDIRRYAAEAISYLSFNADIKEYIVNDNDILNALYKLAKEEDSEEYVVKRVDKLITSGIVSALIPLCKTESSANREALSRVFLACSGDPKHRGILIQQGGAKALLSLTLSDNTDEGKIIAAHALAKIFVTNNPELSFPGDKYLDLVRPLLILLHVERTNLQNFEALMALTNISSISQTAKKRILLENGMSDIVNYLYDDNPPLRRAATECLCNLMLSPEFTDKFCEIGDDRVKMVALVISDTEDLKLQLAAAGTLCSLVSNDNALRKILEINSIMDILRVLLLNEDIDLKFRGIFVLRSLIYASDKFAEKFVTDDLYYALIVIARPDTNKEDSKVVNPLVKEAREIAEETLEKCKEYGFVKDNQK
ncbi:protein unc-45 homolog B-like isoform X2 [Gordionus sp. m RMFG-2023]|uniref:protein unc-45 homolog B-like isoform X2 n=1 Tax=Gordionus sp. m RMFG-2023 TaxID=3053472 RepID=UPI0031FC9D6E